MSDADRKQYWDDGLHFTAAGYDLVGSLIAKELVKLISKEESANTFEGAARRPLKSDLKVKRHAVGETHGAQLIET